jgi:hypothetical protein
MNKISLFCTCIKQITPFQFILVVLLKWNNDYRYITVNFYIRNAELFSNLGHTVMSHMHFSCLQDSFSVKDSPIWQDASTGAQIIQLQDAVGGAMVSTLHNSFVSKQIYCQQIKTCLYLIHNLIFLSLFSFT